MTLIKWNSNISLNSGSWEPTGFNSLLLRGCVLKNTDYIYGIVVYTGHESKVMLNSKEAPSKTSNVLRRMNKMLYTVFAFQAIICFTFAAASVSWQSANAEDHTYLDEDKPAGETYIIQLLTFYVAYSHLIPISLYVALEVVKMALAYLIG
jgi:phospholipid-transporting ATPase